MLFFLGGGLPSPGMVSQAGSLMHDMTTSPPSYRTQTPTHLYTPPPLPHKHPSTPHTSTYLYFQHQDLSTSTPTHPPIHPTSTHTHTQHQDLPQLHGEEGAQAAHPLRGGPLRRPLHRSVMPCCAVLCCAVLYRAFLSICLSVCLSVLCGVWCVCGVRSGPLRRPLHRSVMPCCAVLCCAVRFFLSICLSVCLSCV